MVNFILITISLITLISCNTNKEKVTASKGTALKKTETIFANSADIKNISLNNDAGEIEVRNGPTAQAQYVKEEWREWCILAHKEESGTIKINVENTSFTGDGGCKLKWILTLPPEGVLTLKMAAGTIKGEGKLSGLKVQLAAGNLSWKDGFGPVVLQVAAGSVQLDNMSFPKEGSSSIEVGTGQVKITSPKETLVTTTTDKALGQVINDFQENREGHQLKIKVAVGQVSHKTLSK